MNYEPSIMVIGLGNPLRGDDGIGWCAVDRIAESVKSRDIEFLKYRELMPEISERVSKAKSVLFIDAAVYSDGEQLDERNVIPAEDYPSLETHQLDPAGLLAFSKALYGNAPEAVIMTVGGESFEYHEELSERAQAGMELLVNRACEILLTWLRSHGKSCVDIDCGLINYLNGSHSMPA